MVEVSIDPTGVWSVRFTELFDECDVIAPEDDGIGFVSEETISRSDDTFMVSADELVFGSINGGLRSPSSLVAEDDVSGDIFGNGTDCALTERLAYNDLTATSANVVYEVTIACNDGTRCDSLFRADATR